VRALIAKKVRAAFETGLTSLCPTYLPVEASGLPPGNRLYSDPRSSPVTFICLEISPKRELFWLSVAWSKTGEFVGAEEDLCPIDGSEALNTDRPYARYNLYPPTTRGKLTLGWDLAPYHSLSAPLEQMLAWPPHWNRSCLRLRPPLQRLSM
jgi:hypothetical protein